ncbi:MAG: hypothetical protein AB8B52_00145 [Winogradskyella sp.]|uniref:hypothetical protein n=1 Tax=Winogradskyella sp. TaxID=1883156 RepID=UPI00385B6D5F
MKTSFLIPFILGLLLCQSCIVFEEEDTGDFPLGSSYLPVIMKRADFETTTVLESNPRAIINSGKIYVKGNYIFINEVNEGFHLINNSDPSNPQNIGFIKVFGSSDLSIKNNVIYANNATDLLAFTIDETSQSLTITKRVANVFPQIWSPEGFAYYNLEEDDIIVNWEPLN